MNGAWVVYEETEEWGGCDLIFKTEADARAYADRPLDKWEQQSRERHKRLGIADPGRRERVVFVPWGECAAAQ